MLALLKSMGQNNGGKKGDKPNGGMSGKGTGKGGVAPEENSDIKEKDWKIKGKLQSGDIIGHYFKRGMPPVGKAAERYKSSIDKSKQQAHDAMSQQGIPTEYRRLVKKYFDSLKDIYEPEPDEKDK